MRTIEFAAASEVTMGRLPKPDPQGHKPVYPIPEPAEYDDEVTDEDIRKIQELVCIDSEDDELELVDGPAW